MVLRLRSDVDYVIALRIGVFGVGVAKGRLGLGAAPLSFQVFY